MSTRIRTHATGRRCDECGRYHEHELLADGCGACDWWAGELAMRRAVGWEDVTDCVVRGSDRIPCDGFTEGDDGEA